MARFAGRSAINPRVVGVVRKPSGIVGSPINALESWSVENGQGLGFVLDGAGGQSVPPSPPCGWSDRVATLLPRP